MSDVVLFFIDHQMRCLLSSVVGLAIASACVRIDPATAAGTTGEIP